MMKKNWKDIADTFLVIFLLALIGLFFANIDEEDKSFCKNVWVYSAISGILIFFIFWLRFYLKQNLKKDRLQTNLEFFKILLPASVTILATIWLLSSGYLNIRAENLKRDIYIQQQKDSSIKKRVTKLVSDSTRLSLKILELQNIVSELEEQIESYPDLEQEIVRLKFENRKLLVNQKFKRFLYNGESPIIEMVRTYTPDSQLEITLLDSDLNSINDNQITLEIESNLNYLIKYDNQLNKFIGVPSKINGVAVKWQDVETPEFFINLSIKDEKSGIFISNKAGGINGDGTRISLIIPNMPFAEYRIILNNLELK